LFKTDNNMKKNEKTMSLVAKLIAGATFLTVLILNVFIFIEKNDSGLSLESLKAYAQTGGSGSESEVIGGAESVGTTSISSSRPCTYTWTDCNNRIRFGNNGDESTVIVDTFCIGQGTVSCTPGSVETAVGPCVPGPHGPC
jgi:hypothetical protein